jgi:hypothetical protein
MDSGAPDTDEGDLRNRLTILDERVGALIEDTVQANMGLERMARFCEELNARKERNATERILVETERADIIERLHRLAGG